jgi:hypothetical protein
MWLCVIRPRKLSEPAARIGRLSQPRASRLGNYATQHLPITAMLITAMSITAMRPRNSPPAQQHPAP